MKKVLSVLLILCFIFSLVACEDDKKTTESKPAGETVNFSEKGFSIIYVDAMSNGYIYCKTIKDAVSQNGGKALAVYRDSEPVNAAGEILIGETNRPQSKKAMDILNEKKATKVGDFVLAYIDGSICIVAANTTGYENAINYFVENHCKDLTVTTDLKHISLEGVEHVVEYANNIELFKYCGTWQGAADDEKTYVGGWNIKYFEVDFTGTEITLNFPESSYFKYKIDNGEYSQYVTHKGEYKITCEGTGKHTLRVYNDRMGQNIFFGSASVPTGQSLTRTANKQHYVQFVGDSITQFGVLYKAAENLGWDHCTTALSGIALCTGESNHFIEHFPKLYAHYGNLKPGMELAFNRTHYPLVDDVSAYGDYLDSDSDYKYNFNTGYHPDVVYIFLGTNDAIKVKDEEKEKHYIDTYKALVGNIMNIYGKDTQVILMNSITPGSSTNRHLVIREAAKQITDLYPNNISFIDSDLITKWGVKPGPDNTHPDEAGYELIAKCMEEYLRDFFK